MEHPLTGGCNCGAVRYEVSKPLVRASYCHCKRCQRRSGTAASAQAHPAPESFRIVSGEEKLRVWTPEDGGEKWFCGECGSALFGSNPAHPEPIGIRMGTFDEDPGVRPSVRQFVAYAAPWEPIPDDGLPRFPKAGTPQAGDRADKPITFPERRVFPEGLGASRLTGEVPRDSNIDPGAMVSEDLAPRKDFKRESQA